MIALLQTSPMAFLESAG